MGRKDEQQQLRLELQELGGLLSKNILDWPPQISLEFRHKSPYFPFLPTNKQKTHTALLSYPKE